MKPAAYWRASKEWSSLVSQRGTVVVSTTIRVAPSDQNLYAPYAFLLISLGDRNIEVMGVPGQTFQSGDSVRLVLRRVAKTIKSQPITYGIKAERYE